ncbi:hypothetical protein PFBG_03697 [Plasmodium falciparum 7G8]|uniref:Uncharacterized protein n=2 Tax=Plasmodium falciparum TaxID=5833 RepID=A0A024W4L1_PLAFA|nr:hypothetical protein PFTANZ_03639 [Plasmodium falciparum Tanzania (2000708)]EUR69483.1 hypothetical protein PFBG_03697 [Plasmodium falciparum 7G8]
MYPIITNYIFIYFYHFHNNRNDIISIICSIHLMSHISLNCNILIKITTRKNYNIILYFLFHIFHVNEIFYSFFFCSYYYCLIA